MSYKGFMVDKRISLMSNKDLHEICNTIPISKGVAQQWWSLFGNVLRMPDETKSRKFAVIESTNNPARRGCHYENITSRLTSNVWERKDQASS